MNAVFVAGDGISRHTAVGAVINIQAGVTVILNRIVLDGRGTVVNIDSVTRIFDRRVFDHTVTRGIKEDILPVAFSRCCFIRGEFNRLGWRSDGT